MAEKRTVSEALEQAARELEAEVKRAEVLLASYRLYLSNAQPVDISRPDACDTLCALVGLRSHRPRPQTESEWRSIWPPNGGSSLEKPDDEASKAGLSLTPPI